MAWLHFYGTAERIPSGWQLVPQDEQNVSINMRKDDVLMQGNVVLVRKGAFAFEISVPTASPARVTPQYRSRKMCQGGKSRCLGGIEYCCDREAKDTCNGLWDDC